MMKLYYAPGACSMSCHIALEEAKLPFEAIRVGWDNSDPKRQELLALNPLGAVPTLFIEKNKTLTQNLAILEYVADQKPESGLLAKAGTWERADTMRWVSFIASDLHKAFGPLFIMDRISKNPTTQADIKQWATGNIDKYLTLLEHHLEGKSFLMGNSFTIADAYLYVVFNWTSHIQFPTEKFRHLNNYRTLISQRPAVQAVLKREGLS